MCVPACGVSSLLRRVLVPNRSIWMTPQEIENRRLVSVREAASLLSVSADTIRRTYASKIIKVSKRRVALRLADIMP